MAIIILAFIASILGMYAKVTLNFWCLTLHAAFTIAVIGGFYIYLIIEFSLGTDKNSSSGGLNEMTIMILLSLPLLIIFAMGIYSLVLILMLDQEIEEREKYRANVVEHQDDDLHAQQNVIEVLEVPKNDGESCIICLNKPKEMAFYPCGHQCLCEECSESFLEQARHRLCPICRDRYIDIIRVYK